jgi:hypothetical protein
MQMHHLRVPLSQDSEWILFGSAQGLQGLTQSVHQAAILCHVHNPFLSSLVVGRSKSLAQGLLTQMRPSSSKALLLFPALGPLPNG